MADAPKPTDIQTHEHTSIRVVAVAQAVVAGVVGFGAPLSDRQSVALIALAGVIGTAIPARSLPRRFGIGVWVSQSW